MTTVLLHSQNLDFLKKRARGCYPHQGSSHLTEAIAAGFGFNKHASLLNALKLPLARIHAAKFSSERFGTRLAELCNAGKNAEAYPLEFSQRELPLTCWQATQSDSIYFKYSKEYVPIIFIKDKKRKYCTIDYDYHFPQLQPSFNSKFDLAKSISIKRLFREFLNLKQLLETPNAIFGGKMVTGWITNVPIIKAEIFADLFAHAYFSIIRELELEFFEAQLASAA